VEQFGTTGHPINTPQWPLRVCIGLTWLDRVGKRLPVKADLLMVIISLVWTVLECGYYNKQ